MGNGVAENGSVFSYLTPQGAAVFPGEDPFTDLWKQMSEGRAYHTFGSSSQSDNYPVLMDKESQDLAFEWHNGSDSTLIKLKVHGQHNVSNALAAASLCQLIGIDRKVIAQGLEQFEAVKGRMQIHHLADGKVVIDDTYNANPDSVIAAIDVLKRFPGPSALVLGAMGEVGANSAVMHAEVGAYAVVNGVSRAFTIGEDTKFTVQVFGDKGQFFETVEDLLQALLAADMKTILIKGSRSMRMERVVQSLLAQ